MGTHVERGRRERGVAGFQGPTVGAVVPGERGGMVSGVLAHPREELRVLAEHRDYPVGERARSGLGEGGCGIELGSYDRQERPATQGVFDSTVLRQAAFEPIDRDGVHPLRLFDGLRNALVQLSVGRDRR
ncbi:hypothetical protein N5079_15300 [Planotetraspora sp. A-T 1434]|uniref:hypothetical protein n=1 Tax=Planotetraspora sp. A-T 1434 TaxID=2979219 RepID=UPI0021BF24F7|nr:hypothetical protein [Planotetraspora sp. A-T 1434]MCT9931580.1 hypothetical protein [Planotetraspora sp. A-T 1434]